MVPKGLYYVYAGLNIQLFLDPTENLMIIIVVYFISNILIEV
jgi:hypothetical protein